MYYIYVLKSRTDGNFYTGFTDNPNERLAKHNSGQVISTKSRIPLDMVYLEGSLNKTDALHREIYLKTSWGKKYIKNRLANYLKG